MANFDIAVGITQSGLNSTLKSFFENPTAQNKIFKQIFTENVSGISVTLNVTIKNTPMVVMAPPSDAKWQQSYGADGKQKTGKPPKDNIFQVLLSNVDFSGTIAGVTVGGTGELEVYGQFSLKNNVLDVTSLSVWLDESEWKKNGITKAIVNAIIIPYALNKINKLLNAVPFPQIPSQYISTSFQDPIIEITNSKELVLATSMVSSPATSLSSYKAPEKKDIYLQADLALINNVIEKKINGYHFEASDSTGDDAAKASAKIQGTVESLVAKIKSGKTVVALKMKDISGYGELSGVATAVAKTILCPIGTAIDAISDPKNWDKVTADFSIKYKPNPLDIPLCVKVTDKESVEVSIGEVDSVQVIAKPNWSGVIGSTLASVAAGFVDLLSAILKGMIVNTIIKKEAQNIEVWKNASITKEIEGINVTLSADKKNALVPQGKDYVVECFTVVFS